MAIAGGQDEAGPAAATRSGSDASFSKCTSARDAQPIGKDRTQVAP